MFSKTMEHLAYGVKSEWLHSGVFSPYLNPIIHAGICTLRSTGGCMGKGVRCMQMCAVLLLLSVKYIEFMLVPFFTISVL